MEYTEWKERWEKLSKKQQLWYDAMDNRTSRELERKHKRAFSQNGTPEELEAWRVENAQRVAELLEKAEQV